MKKTILLALVCAMLLSLSACGGEPDAQEPDGQGPDTQQPDVQEPDSGEAGSGSSLPSGVPTDVVIPDGVRISLSDDGITADGQPVTDDASAGLYTAHDIVYYEAGRGFTYGEGTEADEHSAEEAAAHTVLHIASPGVYVLSGRLSAGQIAVDLGEDAENDPAAVVSLVLSGVDITCTVAPAIIFYNVYECGDKDSASAIVDTSAAGANVYVADDTDNTVNGSYVARIYKSVELSEDGTQVVDSKKLHKYDGALYSKMSMNVTGNAGHLTINAENEGLDSELHLTINGGVIDIVSGNDGINTNEDGVSVTTVNAGALTVTVTGATGEGDGIDSNGWLVLNGGTVRAYACASSGDAGIDSDMGILLNGGTVIATGNMLDAIDQASTQKYLLFDLSRSSADNAGVRYTLKDAEGNQVLEVPTANRFSLLLISDPSIADGLYALYNGSTLAGSAQPGASAGFDRGGFGGRPGDFGGGAGPGQGGGRTPGDGRVPGDGQVPPDMSDGQAPGDGQTPPDVPEGLQPGDFGPGSVPSDDRTSPSGQGSGESV